MIQGTETQDNIIQRQPKTLLRRVLPAAAIAGTVIVLAAAFFNSIGETASLVLPRSQMQFATVLNWRFRQWN